MTLVPSFVDCLQPFAMMMTVPTFESFQMLITGWVFAPRRTVTGMIVAAQVVGRKHHSAFHRIFANARWSLDAVGLALFDLMSLWLRGTVFLAVDDTLARKRGSKIFGVGMHHDPLISTRKTGLTNWGHSWVILGVIVTFPLWPDRPFCLPILFRLYLNKKKAAKHRRVYRTRPELANQMLQLLCKHCESRRFHLIADSAYGGKSVLKCLPVNCDLTSRLHMDARLYDDPPVRKPGQPGRPRKRGERLPTPRELLQDRCGRMHLDLYGRRDQARMKDQKACWHCLPDRSLRVVAVDPLKGGRKPQAFYSTCHESSAEEVLTWYAMRWSIEVAFHDGKQHLGFEEPQNWTRQAVERTAPVAMLLYSLIVLWFANEGYKHYRTPNRPWYPQKTHASFADMLGTLKSETIHKQFLSTCIQGRGRRKLNKLLKKLAILVT